MTKKISKPYFPLLAATAFALSLAGCGSSPRVESSPQGNAPQAASAKAGRTSYRVNLDNEFVLDYVVEVKPSSVDGKACYAFISGGLTNNSTRTLSKKSVLDFIVMSNGAMVFRDLSNPVANIPPGGRALFELVDSPVHKNGCPVYDRIDVFLRKTFADSPEGQRSQ